MTSDDRQDAKENPALRGLRALIMLSRLHDELRDGMAGGALQSRSDTGADLLTLLDREISISQDENGATT
ncbi:hypothetical protein [Chelativorans sp. AA-79]|uniref:hypothetical protein n=1 Tax=Chelativorans sp. AA-79 TaxID=3028735 RepID=UPI0023F648E0|nr:hypothetical protein [Chelativorans sp. AA-79]WEX08262.1 hypothetical protein PVE73_19600 [Chelativorans sp. AA-79]